MSPDRLSFCFVCADLLCFRVYNILNTCWGLSNWSWCWVLLASSWRPFFSLGAKFSRWQRL